MPDSALFQPSEPRTRAPDREPGANRAAKGLTGMAARVLDVVAATLDRLTAIRASATTSSSTMVAALTAISGVTLIPSTSHDYIENDEYATATCPPAKLSPPPEGTTSAPMERSG